TAVSALFRFSGERCGLRARIRSVFLLEAEFILSKMVLAFIIILKSSGPSPSGFALGGAAAGRTSSFGSAPSAFSPPSMDCATPLSILISDGVRFAIISFKLSIFFLFLSEFFQQFLRLLAGKQFFQRF